jgi:hypothetical protein
MATRARAFLSTALLLTSPLCGCVRGLIYQDITRPLTKDMQSGALSDRIVTGSVVGIREPFTVVNASVEWSSYGIGDVATHEGMKQVCGADLRRQSAVLGIWHRETVKVIGCKQPEDAVVATVIPPADAPAENSANE